ncbi:C40 family peptidase [Mucilaginibacter glaciei]|uniref:C40 family peptidase n=1 Tax=Mucilaginibacter glaciei TaxID=2772109 RepID=A0A926NUI5_9SPHI|nr:NlpC/P60 family protein [Mucilaginibacter glaciei]MBD1394837.1 C40 family peptidase [Mucilaginibacter glaciei]
MRSIAGCFILFTTLLSCGEPRQPTYVITNVGDTLLKTPQNNIPPPAADATGHITTVITGTTTPQELIAYAKTLTGVKYKYGSTDPEEGFDCSGFITYVFNHFKIAVPRTSVDFTYVQKEIDVNRSTTGDLILFTGTDSTIRVVGHMGIITSNIEGDVRFIHSTSGRANGVTETSLAPYYKGRFIKAIRIFPQNDRPD